MTKEEHKKYKFDRYKRIYPTLKDVNDAIMQTKWEVYYFRHHKNEVCLRSAEYELKMLVEYREFILNGGLTQMEFDFGL